MLKEADVVRVELSEKERAIVAKHGRAAEVNGKSEIYGITKQRKDELGENQIVAMASEAAFAKWAGGEPGFRVFVHKRELQNLNPYKGDGGCDYVLPDGRRIDVKGSETKQDLAPSEALRLCLTQLPRTAAAVHDTTTYVLGVTKREAPDWVPRFVYFSGWLKGNELRGRTDRPDVLKGWSAQGYTLHHMQELVVNQSPMEAIATRYTHEFGGNCIPVGDDLYVYCSECTFAHWVAIRVYNVSSKQIIGDTGGYPLQADYVQKIITRTHASPSEVTLILKFEDGTFCTALTQDDLLEATSRQMTYQYRGECCVTLNPDVFVEW